MIPTPEQLAAIAAIGDWIASAKVKDALELAVSGEHMTTPECSGAWSEREEGQRRLSDYALQADELSTRAAVCGLHDLSRVMDQWAYALRRWHTRKVLDALSIWCRLDVRLKQEVEYVAPLSFAV